MSDRDYSKTGQSNALQTIETSLDVDELHMRETLGLNGRGRSQTRPQLSQTRQPLSGATKQRHRFVQDGEVQVTHITGLRDNDASNVSRARIATLESTLVTEQAARSRAETAVQAGLAQIHAIETKLAHVEMAAKDTIQTERKARIDAESALAAAVAGREEALLRVAELTESIRQLNESVKQLQTETTKVKEPAKPVVRVPKVRAAPRAKTPRVKEPQPVKWWISKSTPKSVKAT